MSVQYSPATEQLEAAVGALLAEDLRDLPEGHRLGNIERLLELREQLSTAIMHRVQIVDTDETTIVETGRATRSWLIEEQLLNPGEASKIRRLAKALPFHPKVDAGLRERTFSVAHAHVIIKAMALVPSEFEEIIETALLELAEQNTPDDLSAAVETLLVAAGVESSADAAREKRLAERGVSIARTFNGMRHINGMLMPEVGEALEIALDQLNRPAGAEDDRTTAQRQHDALGELANHYLAHDELSAINGERPRVVVTIDYAALEGDLRAAWGRLPSGTTVSPQTARRLACDAEILPVLLGANSAVLDIADNTKRCFSHPVRRAAWIEQDGQCAFPGCRRPPVDCHHIIWWSNGGQSVLDNAAWLCAFHHWLIHERSWSMRREPDRSLVFTDPAGIEHRRKTEAA